MILQYIAVICVALKGKGYIVFFVAFVLLVPIIIGGYIFFGPKDIRGVYAGYDGKKMSFTNHKDGDTETLYGKITKIEYYNTTYGNYSLLTLDDTPKINDLPVGVFVISKSSYHVGDSISITLHFRKYHYNNDTIVAPQEFYTPFYSTILGIETVMRSSGRIRGINLIPTPTEQGMYFTVYLSLDSQQSGYSLDLFSLSIGKGHGFGINEITGLVPESNFGTRVDWNENLSGPSANGLIEFKDVVGSGMLNTGDTFLLKLPSTKGDFSYDSYVIHITGEKILSSYTYFANGPHGVFDYPSGGLTDMFHLALKNETKEGNEWKQTISLVDLPGIIVPMRYDLKRIIFAIELHRLPVCKVSLEFGVPRVCSEQAGYQISVKDLNGDGYLSTSDELMVNGTEKTSSKELAIYENKTGNAIGRITWINGIGVVTGVSWRAHIEYSISKSSSSNVTLNIDKIYGESGLILSTDRDSFKFNAELFEDYRSIMNKTIADGFMGISNGTALRFVDHDYNGYFNAGDKFEIDCTAGKYYKLRLSGGQLYAGVSSSTDIDLEWKT